MLLLSIECIAVLTCMMWCLHNDAASASRMYVNKEILHATYSKHQGASSDPGSC